MKLLKCLSQIPDNAKAALYGAGQAGSNFLKILNRFRPDVTVSCFIDSFKTGSHADLPVVSLNEFLKTYSPEVMILITSLEWRSIETSFTSWIADGSRHYLIAPPHFLVPSGFSRLINDENHKKNPLENTLCTPLFSPADHQERRKDLQRVEQLLSHPEDRCLFNTLTGDPNSGEYDKYADMVLDFYYHSPLKRQYVDFIRYNNVKTIIEGGVFDGGDTVEFLKQTENNTTIYGFEPNYRDYEQGPYKQILDQFPSVNIYPRGLWSHQTRMSFNVNGLSSAIVSLSEFTENTGVGVEVISIDEFVNQQGIEKIGMIKLDVEGAEMDVLRGAIHTLKNHRPQLAICIYHKKEHFIDVPLFLRDLLTDYTYRLGHYTACHLETVWYGIPNELL
ncbi:MAG: FkbM family methyltransferase [Candidatus Omnitrophota bacterium]